jgi:hypothetical protein
VGRRDGRRCGGLDLVIGEGRGSPEGGVHRGMTLLARNGGGGRRPVVGVVGSWLGKVVGTRAVVGAASKERVDGRRRLGSDRCLE